MPPDPEKINLQVSQAASHRLGQDCPPESIVYMFQGENVNLDSWQLCADVEAPDRDIVLMARCLFSKPQKGMTGMTHLNLNSLLSVPCLSQGRCCQW